MLHDHEHVDGYGHASDRGGPVLVPAVHDGDELALELAAVDRGDELDVDAASRDVLGLHVDVARDGLAPEPVPVHGLVVHVQAAAPVLAALAPGHVAALRHVDVALGADVDAAPRYAAACLRCAFDEPQNDRLLAHDDALG